MTLPPGLKAVRDIPEWRCTQIAEHVPELLDLIETLAGALGQAKVALNQLARNRTYWEDFAPKQEAVHAALDKYREFK